MPADIQLSGMEVSLVIAMSRETILRQYLDTVKGQYSHILIDCQPSLGMLTVNALAAANRIIIPVQAEYLPAKGLEQLLSTVNKVKSMRTSGKNSSHRGCPPARLLLFTKPIPKSAKRSCSPKSAPARCASC